MSTFFTRGMAKATELTRAGRLQEATAMIRSLLNPADVRPNSSEPMVAGEVVDGEFTRLSPTPPAPPERAAKPDRAAKTSLAETLRSIAAGGMPARGPLTATPPALAPGAQFLSLTCTAPQGSRTYRLYIPGKRSDLPMPLVVMLHGCTQTPEDFATGTGMNGLAEAFGCLIAYPGQPSGANAQKCWNWFRPEDQARNRGEPALLVGMVRDILRDQSADGARVYVAGLSAGGAAAAILGNLYPDVFAAIGVHSGLPAGAARDIPTAFSAMRNGAPGTPTQVAVPTIVFHGKADSTVHPGNGRALLQRALEAHPRLTLASVDGAVSGGRSYRQTRHVRADGRSMAEHWEIDGAGHAWAGGQADGSYTDPKGPDASREMLRFFLQHRIK